MLGQQGQAGHKPGEQGQQGQAGHSLVGQALSKIEELGQMGLAACRIGERTLLLRKLVEEGQMSTGPETQIHMRQ